jgi:hypothetical protein
VPDDKWAAVASFSDRASAEAILGLLIGNNLPGYIASNEHVPGLGTNFSACVPAHLLHRAQWILEQCRVSEEELTYLATGELPEGAEDA